MAASVAFPRPGRTFLAPVLLLVSAAAGACGDDDGLPPAADYQALCASPRSGNSPVTGDPYPDRQGIVDDEKRWLRSWTDELYLWYAEVPDQDPDGYPTPLDYFAVLRTPATTSSGRPKDRFHFTYSTDAWESLAIAGITPSYGLTWTVLAPSPPRSVVVAYTEPVSPATDAGIDRGAQVLAVDGVDLIDGTDVDTLNAGLFPAGPGESHSFDILDAGATEPRTVVLTTAPVDVAAVQTVAVLDTDSGPVGYLHFTDHIASAEAALVAAVAELAAAGVTDLVLDMRYNSGGYLAIASELAYMVAGPTAAARGFFERIVFNDKYPTHDPVTGAPLSPMPFYDQAVGFSLPDGDPLPTLGLARVFVLTGPGTCSASESVINGLRGVDVEVIQIGATTCGKPFGFYPQDNCGTMYFSIQFQGLNAKEFGDYPDGFIPGDPGPTGIPGCQVADDFTHLLGDPAEARLAAALQYRATASCPAAAAARSRAPLSAVDGETPKSPWHANRQVR